MMKQSLSGLWKMKEAGGFKSYDAEIPGSVMSVLLSAGEIEDPFFRNNEQKMGPVFEKDYEFFRSFTVTGEHLMQDETDLIFYGIDTVADIFLNGKKLGRVNNMHRTYRFAVKELLTPGANDIRILIHSPLKCIAQYRPAEGKEIRANACGTIPGNQYLRKAHSMFGWDWGPQLPDAGIFRDIVLESYSKVRIEDVFITQEHSGGNVTLLVDPILHMTDNIPMEIEVFVTGQEPALKLIRMPEQSNYRTSKGENTIRIPIRRPKFWWPNGLGEQPLYEVHIVVRKAGTVYDEKKYRIGLRTVSLLREKDEYGESFVFVVNGRKIFAMGADYIPEDCIYSRITKERQRELVCSAARANFNFLRIWGGGYYPSDDFYDLCDEYGILVWQDLMYACNLYELTEEMEENILAETGDNVARLRHHASLALWCGNNEMEMAWADWSSFQEHSPLLKSDYIKMFEYLLPKAVQENDPVTDYWPSSPSSGGSFDNPQDENRGDTHFWDVWHGQKPFEEYRNHYFRFCSEFGFQSFPCKKTVDSYTVLEDRNIFSPVMENHQKNGWANGKIIYYISENFLYPKDFESILYVSQLLQAMAMRCGVEHFRRNRGRCMGALYWQLNDNWPVASWSGIDYYGRWKALHYMAKRFYAPIAASLLREGDKITPFVANEGTEDTNCKVKVTLYDMDGKDLLHYEDEGRSYSERVLKLKTFEFGRMLEKYGRENVFVEAEFIYGNGKRCTETEIFVPYKHLNLKNPSPVVTVEEEEEYYSITVETDTFTPFLMLDLIRGDAIFEDNVFFVSPKTPAKTRLWKTDIKDAEIQSAKELSENLKIMYLQESYAFDTQIYTEEEVDLEKDAEEMSGAEPTADNDI